MRKKLIALLIAGTMIMAPVCVHADEKDDRIAELETKISEMQKIIDYLNEKLQKYEGSEIEQYLLDKGVLTGDRIEMDADMIGAVSGFKYGSAEIYEYDTESDKYKTLSSGGSIGLDGFEGVSISASAVNGKYVLIGNNLPEDLITAFNEFK